MELFCSGSLSLWQGGRNASDHLLAGLQSIPEEIREAAKVDGANRHQIFWKIELPLPITKYLDRLYYGAQSRSDRL